MATTANLRGTKLEVGQAQKEATINGLFDLFDSAISGKLDVSITAADVTLTGTPAAPQAQNKYFNLSGTLTGNRSLIFPVNDDDPATGNPRTIYVKNGTSGAFTVTVKVSGQTGVMVTQGHTAILLHNGTDFVRLYEVNHASGIVDTGTAFPASPATNARFFRSDRGIEYYYDGTRWLSVQVFTDALPQGDVGVLPYSVTAAVAERISCPYAGTHDLWLVELQSSFFVNGGTALSGSHKWVSVLTKTAGAVPTAIATQNIDSGASSTWRVAVVSIGALLGTTHSNFHISHTKTGTPGDLYSLLRIVYRLVG